MKTYSIINIDSIYNIFFELYTRVGDKFDPEIDIHTLRDAAGIAVFSNDEADYLDDAMIQSFIFCVLNGLNIDTIAAMVDCDIKSARHAA